MVKANELRLGNLVYLINRSREVHLPVTIPLQVLCVDLFEVAVLDVKLNPATVERWPYHALKDIDPIPITEEWLIKLGFQAEKLGSIFCSADKIKAESYKDIGTTSPDFFFNNRLKRWMDCQTRVCVDYVHQLQNLYFALTGEELTIVAVEGKQC